MVATVTEFNIACKKSPLFLSTFLEPRASKTSLLLRLGFQLL